MKIERREISRVFALLQQIRAELQAQRHATVAS
jgi:hypothetical protein